MGTGNDTGVFYSTPLPGYESIPQVSVAIRAVVIILGVPANLLSILTTVLSHKMHTATNILMIQISIAGLIPCFTNFPYTIYVMLHPKQAHTSTICKVLSHLLFTTVLMSMMSFALVAIDRYTMLLKGKAVYNKHFTKRRVTLLTMVTWFWAFAQTTPPLLGIGAMGYNRGLTDCTPFIYDITSYVYLCVLVVMTMTPSILVTTVCYSSIVCMLWTVKNRLQDAGFAKALKVKRKAQTNQSLLFMIVIFLSYAIIWTPYGLMILCDVHRNWSPVVYFVLQHLTNLQCILYPVMYACVSKTHRRAHRLVLQMKWKELRTHT